MVLDGIGTAPLVSAILTERDAQPTRYIDRTATGRPHMTTTANPHKARNRTATVATVVALVVGVVVLAAGIASGQRTPTFTDVPEGSYYHDAAYWAADAGVTTGCGDDKFCPDNNLTRAQMITFLYRYDTYAASHTHPPDHTHEVREVESDPIRVEGPAGTDQDCTNACNITQFDLEPHTVLLVGKDIAPGFWLTPACAVVLTKEVRKHPQYPGRDTWRSWQNDLWGVQTGVAKHSDGEERYTNGGLELLASDYAVIYTDNKRSRCYTR